MRGVCGLGAGGGLVQGREGGLGLVVQLRFRNGLGRTLALQSFRITHLTNAEILAKFCTTRSKKKAEKTNFNVTFYLLYNPFI